MCEMGGRGTLKWFVFVLSAVSYARGKTTCLDYISFPNLEKRDVNYTRDVSDSPLSDMYIAFTKDWYGEEGYDLALSPPPADEDRCGTTYPIWINDTLPTGQQQKVVKACLVDIGNDCSKTFGIPVKNCGKLRVYQLRAVPVFESAYCVGLTDPSKPASTFTVKPKIEVAVKVDNRHYDHFKFKCPFVKSADNLLYGVHWYVNGGFIHSFPAVKWDPNIADHSALTEDILRNNGYASTGFDLQCAVKASLGKGFPAGKGILSDKKFVGIQVPNATVQVTEGEEKAIDLKLTVPLGCGGRSDCTMMVYVMAMNTAGDCDPSAFVKTQCGVKIKGSSWDKPHKLEIRGKYTQGYNAKTTVMKLFLKTAPNVISHPFWSNYSLNSITVQVHKNAPTTTKTYCYAHSDPHMKTYDGRLYEFHDDGVYVLYKHDHLESEVQMQLRQCSAGSTVRCPCGVAVRAGKTVFRINKCDRKDWDIQFDCKDGKDLIKVLKRGTQYKIYLPTGSHVEVSVNPSSHFFQVHLYPSNEDLNKVSGLCGTYTGICSDDFKKADGTYSSSTNAKSECNGNRMDKFDEFSHSWRAKVDLFNYDDYHRIMKWSGNFILCTCDQHNSGAQTLDESVTCSTAVNRNVCVFNKMFRPPPSASKACAVETNRRKRSAISLETDRKKRNAEPAGGRIWTQTAASDYCGKLFNESKSISLCKTVEGMSTMIEATKATCIQDIMATNSTVFAIDAIESTKSLCMHEVEMNSTLQEETQPGVPSFYDAFVDVTCLNDCSGKGTCKNGTCSCEEGFGGDDCSKDKSVPPDVYGLVGHGYCDKAKENCDEISIIGDYFDEYAQIKCRFVPFKMYADNTTTSQKAEESRPLVESFSEAICILPKTRRRRSTNTKPPSNELASGFKISIANYGDVFSDEKVLIIYNSACQSCSVAGNSVTCSFTTKSCMVDGVCVAHGETHPNNHCYKCDASVTLRKWVKKNDASCPITATPNEASPSKLWIIGAVIGGVFLSGLVIGAFLFYKKSRASRKVVDTPRGSAFMINAVPTK